MLSAIINTDCGHCTAWIFVHYDDTRSKQALCIPDLRSIAKGLGLSFLSVLVEPMDHSNINKSNAVQMNHDDTSVATNHLKELNLNLMNSSNGIIKEHIPENSDTPQNLVEDIRLGAEYDLRVKSEKSGVLSQEVSYEICSSVSSSQLSQWPGSELKYSKVSPEPLKTFADIKGFKHVFINTFHKLKSGSEVNILCWLLSRPRDHGSMLFLPVGDSTGRLQVVIEKTTFLTWTELKNLAPESSMVVNGFLQMTRGKLEITAREIKLISEAKKRLHPEIRKASVDLLAHHNTDRVLNSRHLYLRNPIFVALNLYRSNFLFAVHKWFRDHQFVDFTAPLITPSLLYEPKSAIHISNIKSNKPLYLSQCAGFYLEAAAHAHERVYNLGPSFRNESRTNRHLMEYWHIKAELCSGEMDDIIEMVELFLRDLSQVMGAESNQVIALTGGKRPKIQIPFARVTYQEALDLLRDKNFALDFGSNISKPAENLLIEHFQGPVWITHKPRELEPFPYCVHPNDDKLTMTADLISSGGFGEICGVAEKSYTKEELQERMIEKGKVGGTNDIYDWVLESRDFGMVPHTAFGMGFERVARWFCGVPHVKDLMPFPRIFDRDPLP